MALAWAVRAHKTDKRLVLVDYLWAELVRLYLRDFLIQNSIAPYATIYSPQLMEFSFG